MRERRGRHIGEMFVHIHSKKNKQIGNMRFVQKLPRRYNNPRKLEIRKEYKYF